jgi:hypothetical protein
MMIRRRAAIETLCDFPEAKYVCEQSYSMQMRFNQEKCFPSKGDASQILHANSLLWSR